MKKLLKTGILLAMMIWCLSAAAEEEAVQYEAYADVTFHLRNEIDGPKGWMKVLEGDEVQVLSWDGDWCFVRCWDETGYCKAKWLYGFRSLDAAKYPLKNIENPMTGILTFHQDVFLKADKFKGLYTREGDAAVGRKTEKGCVLPIWRGEMEIREEEAEYLPFVPWEEAKSGDVIGGFTTLYGDQQGKRTMIQERGHNISLGCQRIHGQEVKAGAEFSFNALCGPYRKSNGYLKAPNISQEGVGYGGGVCQVSTTLYNALIQLPLQIEKWSIHQRSGVPYVPQYFDAAVGGSPDLMFINTLPYDIEIQAFPQGGVLTVLIVRK